jgi:type IV secretion system protein VirB1
VTGPLTAAVVLAMASTCQGVIAPETVFKIAQHESGLDPTRIHVNLDRTLDVGLMQINTRNFDWLGLTMADALDPCRSIAAGAQVLIAYSRYNTGSPTRGIANGYALAVQGVPVDPSAKPAPPQAASNDPPVIYVRPAHSGRNLVYSTERN